MNYLPTGKNRIMKTKLYTNTRHLFILVILTSLMSCIPDGEYSYSLKNESGKNIKINSYSSNGNLTYSITINNNEELIKNGSIPGGTPGPSFLEVFFNYNDYDSISIIYDNSKISEFDFNTESESERNLLVSGNSTFTFTEEDYQNAEDCNGNCE